MESGIQYIESRILTLGGSSNRPIPICYTGFPIGSEEAKWSSRSLEKGKKIDDEEIHKYEVEFYCIRYFITRVL